MSTEESSFLTDSSWGRPAGALFSPVATFRSLRQRPTWVVALVVLILITTVVQALTFTKVDMVEAIEKQVAARNVEMGPEEVQRAADLQTKFGFGCALVLSPAFYLVVALLFMVLLNLAGGELTFVGSLSVVVHALMPFAIAGLLSAVVIAGRNVVTLDEVQSGTLLASNLGAFAPADASAMVVALLSSVDVFSIWCMGLLTVGYAEMAGVTRAKAATVTIVLWLLGVAVKVGLSAFAPGAGA